MAALTTLASMTARLRSGPPCEVTARSYQAAARMPGNISAAVVVVAALASACSGAPAGDPCPADGPAGCATGLCTPSDPRNEPSVCTNACETDADCSADGLELCHDGICIAACRPRSGESGQWVCIDEVPVACENTDHAATCVECGCDVFGFSPRADCIAGTGCQEPSAIGEPCLFDSRCASGFCDESVCAAPRAVGDACRRDAACESANCSNEGNPGAPGTCNVPLGAPCDSTTACNECREGICFQEVCATSSDDSCPTGYECHSTVTDETFCYEQCWNLPSEGCSDSLLCCRTSFGDPVPEGERGICVRC